jgi:DNA-binding SARP family transcriptional activator
MLRIRTLGASEITVAGARVGAEQPMTFALLLLLAVSGSAGLTRRELAATLWPNSADRDRNHRLRSLLHRLRRIGAPVASSGATVSLGPSAIDFREFITLPASLDAVHKGAETIGAVLPGLAASSPALADHLDDIRDLIVGTIMRWLTAGVALARAAGDWPLVERLACAAEQIDPGDDRAVLQRAEAVCLTGGAERAVALLDELTVRRGTDEEVRLAADTLRRRIVSSVASDVSAGSPPLVGRDDIVKRLWSALTRAVGGRGGGVVLWGPAGIGKTRILRALDAVRLTGAARLVRFEARPAHGLRPFAMILELAGCLLEEPGAAGCDPRAYALLVRARDADVPNDSARGTAGIEEAFCDAVAELLAAVSDESPTILTIDDVHAADGAIWRVLRNLIRWSADRRLLWVFAYRALHEAELAQLPEPSVLQRVRVQCLDATASTTLTRAIARSPATDHERLFDVAGGHPLLLQAVARTGGDVPAELEWLVDDWIARLPGESLRALRLVAALGTVTPRALADLGIFSRAELGVVLGDLERIGMIREERGALRAHRVWAAAALATLARGERATLDLDSSLAVPAMSER